MAVIFLLYNKEKKYKSATPMKLKNDSTAGFKKVTSGLLTKNQNKTNNANY